MVGESRGSNLMETENFVCIECGAPAEDLFKQYSRGTLKLAQCKVCHENVDKYIEYDIVLILLDVLLHKSQAYHHVLFNIKLKAARQLFALSVLCDTYMKWVTFRHMYLGDFPSTEDWHLVLELQFYVMLCVSTSEFLVNIFVTAAIVLFANHQRNITTIVSFQNLLRILVLASFGKLLAVFALIWNKDNSHAYLILTKIFVITSNTEAVKVISKRKFPEALLYVLCGVISGHLIQDYAIWIVFSNWQI